MPIDLTDPEDTKLVTLARAHRARARAAEGAAVRDTDGRTYSAATVTLPTLSLTALQAAVAQAATSGADGLEAAVVLGEAGHLSGDDVAVVRDLAGPGVPVYAGTTEGDVVAQEAT